MISLLSCGHQSEKENTAQLQRVESASCAQLKLKPSFPLGSVNEDQILLGRQFISFIEKGMKVQVKV